MIIYSRIRPLDFRLKRSKLMIFDADFEAIVLFIKINLRLLKERVYHLPIINDTPAEKSRYRRKLEEKQNNIALSRKKYDFKTYDNYSSHYFLTGARFNR